MNLTLTLSTIVVILAVFYFIYSYNKLAKYLNGARKSWIDIDQLFKKRYELIVDFMAIGRPNMPNDNQAFEELISSRNIAIAAIEDHEESSARLAKEKTLEDKIKYILNVSDKYQELKSNRDFLFSVKQVIECNSQIVSKEQEYAQNVTKFNALTEVFPTDIISRIMNFKKL